MKRKELFEFEDFAWFPAEFRQAMTRLIQVLHRMTGTADVLAGLVRKAREQQAFDRVVDLGSGSGGPMPAVLERLNAGAAPGAQLQLMLTDLYPQETAIRAWEGHPQISYKREPVDATHLEEAPGGLKTMVASFHHMAPTPARAILKSAEASRQPLLVYEIAENTIPFALWLLLLPLSLVILVVMALFMTPFARPNGMTLVFTYVIPLIPLAYAWDGQASLMRTYTLDDVKELLGPDPAAGYAWEMGAALDANGKKKGYYVLGMPA